MKKWQWIVTICLLVANAIILIYQRNWTALMWESGCAFFLHQSLAVQKIKNECFKTLFEQSDFIRKLTQQDTYKQLIEAERKAECYLANCDKALKKMTTLKNLNEGLFETINDLRRQVAERDLTIKELRKKHGKQE